MKAIMYHYVRKPDPAFPYFKYLHVDDFQRQLDYFEANDGFLSFEEFADCLKTGHTPKGVVLTFDDGIKDHYQYVLPVLQQRNLWGMFYITTNIYQDQRLLDVHRVHLLLGRFPAEEVYEYLRGMIQESMLTHQHIKEFQQLTYSDQVNDDFTRLVKRTLNYFLAHEHRQAVLDLLMQHFLPEEDRLFDAFYLTAAEIRALHDAGMVIGSHTVTHPVMANLPLEAQEREIADSFRFLRSIVGEFRAKTFCYPYGGFHSFSNETENMLFQNNCVFSFNVETRDIQRSDLLLRPQALPRYDCNYFPFGQCRDVALAALRIA
jgi:peptidoglycan/xylan/chitin deacetylase (PgdA/CDA1 family)